MTPRQQLVAVTLGVWLMKGLMRTLRFHIDDRAGIGAGGCDGPALWIFWHNRMLVMPYMHARYFRPRKAVVLTSASKDGELVARVVRQFGFGAVRGSTSRRGVHALLELATAVERGLDAGITPDGPRGPRYHLSRGVIALARKTGAPIVPCHVRYSRCVRLRSWDRFMIPLPFARVDITLLPLERIPAGDDAALECERARIEAILAGGESDGGQL